MARVLRCQTHLPEQLELSRARRLAKKLALGLLRTQLARQGTSIALVPVTK